VLGLERLNRSVPFGVAQLQIELSLSATSVHLVQTATRPARWRGRAILNARGFAAHPVETIVAFPQIRSMSGSNADGGSGW
jgi:hypothetical protein